MLSAGSSDIERIQSDRGLLRAFGRVARRPLLWMIPLLLDWAAIAAGVALIGFRGEPGYAFQLLLHVGMPSIGHLTDRPLLAGTASLLGQPDGASALAWSCTLLFFLGRALLQGGYISALNAASRDESIGAAQFVGEGRRYWARFALFAVLASLTKTAAAAVSIAVLGVSGLAVALLAVAALRLAFVYIEFTLVVHNMRIGLPLLRRSWAYVKAAPLRTLRAALPLPAFAGAASFIVQHNWSIESIVIVAGIYAFVMSGLQILLLETMRHIRHEEGSL